MFWLPGLHLRPPRPSDWILWNGTEKSWKEKREEKEGGLEMGKGEKDEKNHTEE